MFPPDMTSTFNLLLTVPEGEANNPTVSATVIQRDESASKYLGAIFIVCIDVVVLSFETGVSMFVLIMLVDFDFISCV